MGKARKRMAQFNVRMDADLLGKYRDYCEKNAVDPHQQIIIFIQRMIGTKYDFQERLWEQMKKK